MKHCSIYLKTERTEKFDHKPSYFYFFEKISLFYITIFFFYLHFISFHLYSNKTQNLVCYRTN